VKQMFMPALALGAALAGIVARLTRSSLLEVLGADYMRTARAKGLSDGASVIGHGLKNALLPVVTVIGLQVGALLGGAILIETIFALPGIGRLAVDSIFARDFPIVQGVVLFLALVRVVANLFADLLYARLDPRIANA
jgi:peptide/nickel transport system permease protein